ncbi:MAG: transglutaminase family protein [Nitrospirota bacterium]|nr:MAG: transglutaminase family protein [Nitrospirota bacterium]
MDDLMDKKVKALLRLLSDTDEQVAMTIQDQLVRCGRSVLPYLTEAERKDPTLSPRAADIREEIHFLALRKEFQQCCRGKRDNIDLEMGAFLIAKSAYPTLEIGNYIQIIEKLAEEVRPRMTPTDSPVQRVHIFNQYLFNEKGFRGNRTDYYDPENSFLNRVIDRRMGIPISLSVLYLLLGLRLGLPVKGVGMPGHFLVKVDSSPPFLFVDCFNGGILLQESDCKKFLTGSGFGFEPWYLEPSPNSLILERMLQNLLGIYQQRQEPHRVKRVNALMAILKSASDPSLN